MVLVVYSKYFMKRVSPIKQMGSLKGERKYSQEIYIFASLKNLILGLKQGMEVLKALSE